MKFDRRQKDISYNSNNMKDFVKMTLATLAGLLLFGFVALFIIIGAAIAGIITSLVMARRAAK